MKGIKRVLLVIVLFLCVFSLTGCGTKKSITANDFKTYMEKSGYYILDSTSQYKDSFTLKQGYIAINANRTYQIEFIEFNTIDEASKIYDINKNIMEGKKGQSISGYVDTTGENFSNYRVVTNGRYRVLSRINNTLIYVDEDQAYMNEINKIIKRLRY